MTRLDLVKSYTVALRRHTLAPSQGLALILMGGREFVTRAEFHTSSGLSTTRARRVLDSLVSCGLASREKGPRPTVTAHIPYYYRLTTQGADIARELLAIQHP